MEKKKVICLVCPLACCINVEIKEGDILKIRGAQCKKGKEYAVQECKEPKRILTATVQTTDKNKPLLSVRTNYPIPKQLITECMKLLSQKIISSPVKIGEVIIKNILETGVNIIATRGFNKN